MISEDTQAEVGRTQVQADGTYMVDGLSEGTIRLNSTLPDGTPWKYTIPKTYDIYDIQHQTDTVQSLRMLPTVNWESIIKQLP